MTGKAVYGWDAPGIMLGMLGGGGLGIAVGVVLAWIKPFALAAPFGVAIALIAAVPFLLGLAMLQYRLAGKVRTRDALLDLVSWRGDEQVLDVGAGAGLLLIGAAKRLQKGGQATGIDLWSSKDLSNNSADVTRRNIAIEGVEDRASIQTGDAIAMPFDDERFDVAVSLLCLHNIEPSDARDRSCSEIARVLKPGGRVVIGDYVPTHNYAKALARAGLEVRHSRSAFSVAGALMWFLVADKPSRSATEL